MGRLLRKLDIFKKLEEVDEFFAKIEEVIIIIFSFLLTAVVLIGVFNRYLLKNSMAWQEEISTFFFMMVVYYGISHVAKDKDGHLRVNILENKIKERIAYFYYLDVFHELICLSVCLLGFYSMLKMSISVGKSTVSLKIPYSIILFSSTVISFFILSFRYFRRFFIGLSHKLGKRRI